MRSLARVMLVAAFCASTACAADAPILPVEPIGKIEGMNWKAGACETGDYSEDDECKYFQSLGEPPIPVTDPETRFGVRFVWSIGERSTTITVRYEIQDAQSGFLFVSEKPAIEKFIVRGEALIPAAEIQLLLDVTQRTDFWSQPETVKKKAGLGIDEEGGPSVYICFSGLTIEGIRHDERHVVDRLCAEDDDPVKLYAKTLLGIARRHFPDLGTGRGWKDIDSGPYLEQLRTRE